MTIQCGLGDLANEGIDAGHVVALADISQPCLATPCVDLLVAMHTQDGRSELGRRGALTSACDSRRELVHPAERFRRADTRQACGHAAQDLVFEASSEAQRRDSETDPLEHVAKPI